MTLCCLPPCPCAHHPPLSAVKQEIDRNEDMLRSCLRAVDALAKMPNAQQVGGVVAGLCAAAACRGDGRGWVVVVPTWCMPPLRPLPPVLPVCCAPHQCHFRSPPRPACPSPSHLQVAPFKQFIDNVVMGALLKVGAP